MSDELLSHLQKTKHIGFKWGSIWIERRNMVTKKKGLIYAFEFRSKEDVEYAHQILRPALGLPVERSYDEKKWRYWWSDAKWATWNRAVWTDDWSLTKQCILHRLLAESE